MMLIYLEHALAEMKATCSAELAGQLVVKRTASVTSSPFFISGLTGSKA